MAGRPPNRNPPLNNRPAGVGNRAPPGGPARKPPWQGPMDAGNQKAAAGDKPKTPEMVRESLTATLPRFVQSVHVGDRVADACEKRGLIVRPIAHLNVLSPPLVLSVEQIDWMVDTLREGIIEVQADLIAEGLWSPE